MHIICYTGGEPFLRTEIIEQASKVQGIIFPVFTNGTLLDDTQIKLLDCNRNIVPVISIEGNKEQTDKRRGIGIYEKLINVMERLKKKQILFGSSITVTRENITGVTDESYIRELYMNGCRVVFYVEYVPLAKGTENQGDGSFANFDPKEPSPWFLVSPGFPLVFPGFHITLYIFLLRTRVYFPGYRGRGRCFR